MSKPPPSPVRKRPRLSLKAGKKGEKTESPCALLNEKVQSPTKRYDDVKPAVKEEILCSPEEVDNGPGIIGFENLGNTCFLNSVLQILRFTPGFVEGLESISKEITQAEKLQILINDHMKKQLEDSYEKPGENLSWQVVRILNELFTRMESREKKVRLSASSTVANMTIKPERLLEKIRQINPMFEGYLQHDAQELLRCLLCYLQDAWKAVTKVKAKSKEINSKKMQKIVSITQFFGKKNGGLSKQAVGETGGKYSAKIALFQKTEILESIDSPVQNSSNNCEDNKSDILDLVKEPGISYDETDSLISGHMNGGVDIKPSQLELQTSNSDYFVIETCKPLHFVDKSIIKTDIKDNMEVTEGEKHLVNGDVKMSSIVHEPHSHKKTPRKRRQKRDSVEALVGQKRGNKRKKSKEHVLPSVKTVSGSVNDQLKDCSKSQSSVLTLFGKSEAGCKRLGMRGAVVAKVKNGQEAPKDFQDKPVLETAQTVRQIDVCAVDCKGDAPEVLSPKLLETNTFSVSLSVKNGDNSSGTSPQDTITSIQTILSTEEEKLASRVDEISFTSEDEVIFKDAQSTKEEPPFDHCQPDSNVISCRLARSPSKRSSGKMEHVSESNLKTAALQDIKQAQVKLEKCDPVCSSPLKSVSANEAIKRLGTPQAIHRDFVEHLFQGEMMLKTRCMECECSKERREVFQDVSVPLKSSPAALDLEESDEEPEEASLSCLMSAFTDVERLCDDNKYFCENCYSYVEAERSLHYESLPEVLTLHLKRFAATSGFLGNLRKINDHIATPEYLPCLRYKCPRPCHRADHRYRLLGFIAHSGLSMTSGHYTSYIRLLPEAKPVQTFLRKEETKSKLAAPYIPSAVESSTMSCATGNAVGSAALPEECNQTMDLPPENLDMICDDYVNKWLECDDDFVQVLNEDDFERRLAPNSGYNATPYVLFYIRENDSF